MNRLLIPTLLLAGLAGCGVKRIPGKIIDQLPYEAKIELLEAENDLALAVDRLDEAKSEVLRAREHIRRAKSRRSAASDEVSAARDPLSRDVAELAVTEADRRVEWLRARQRVNVKEEDVAAQNLTCAKWRFELSRLTTARKAKLEGSEQIDPASYEVEVKSCEERVAELKEAAKQATAEAEALRGEWDQARAALAKKTFDARASPYVE